MITFMIILAFVMIMLWIGFKLTGALLAACFWLCIKIPLAVISFALGLVCCCTIILIPIGLFLFKAGIRFLIPGCLI